MYFLWIQNTWPFFYSFHLNIQWIAPEGSPLLCLLGFTNHSVPIPSLPLPRWQAEGKSVMSPSTPTYCSWSLHSCPSVLSGTFSLTFGLRDVYANSLFLQHGTLSLLNTIVCLPQSSRDRPRPRGSAQTQLPPSLLADCGFPPLEVPMHFSFCPDAPS